MKPTLDPRILHAAEVLMHQRVTPQQAIVLYACSADPPPTMTALSELCRITTAGMTNSIDRLVRLGWVKRQAVEDDRRSIRISVTALGSATIAKLNNAISTL